MDYPCCIMIMRGVWYGNGQRTATSAGFAEVKGFTAYLLKPGEDFKDLPETYVIFITENDVIGGNLPDIYNRETDY